MRAPTIALRALTLAGILGSSAACDNASSIASPVQGASVSPARRSPAPLSSANVTNGSDTFVFDQTHYWGCAGEMVHNHFEVTYDYTLVELPTGEHVYRALWPTGVLGTITGLSSGTVWVRERTLAPQIQRSTGGGMESYTVLAWFVSETGPTIQVHENYHLSANANGEVTADVYSSDCRVK